MRNKVTLLKIGRYIVGGFMCYQGSVALFSGVAYSGIMIRGEGVVARIAGLCFILGGVMLIFDKWKMDHHDGNPDP